MKIFSWVHKRFHHNMLNSLAQNVDKTETENINTVKDTLNHDDLVDKYDVWEDGILTIGTFGFPSLKPFNQQKEYLVLESEEDNNEEKINQGNSLHGIDGDDEEGENNNMEEEDEEANPLISTIPLTPIVVASDADTGIEQDNAVKSDGKKKGQRTTLADLFLADSDFQMKLDSEKPLCKKIKFQRKNNLSFAKKLIPRLKDDSSPRKNMQSLMRRMLKRKIHPELDNKIHKSELETASESVYLLPIPGLFTIISFTYHSLSFMVFFKGRNLLTFSNRMYFISKVRVHAEKQ